jgi:hypothetical protein
MNFIAKNIHIIGLLLLTTFVAAAAGLYFDVPARFSGTAVKMKVGTAPREPLTRPAATLFPSDGERDGVRGHSHLVSAQLTEVAATYSCPMHPEVSASQPGDCPKCGMALSSTVAKNETKPAVCQHADVASSSAGAASTHAGCSHTEEGNAGGCCVKKVQPAASALPGGCTRNLHPQTTNSSE